MAPSGATQLVAPAPEGPLVALSLEWTLALLMGGLVVLGVFLLLLWLWLP